MTGSRPIAFLGFGVGLLSAGFVLGLLVGSRAPTDVRVVHVQNGPAPPEAPPVAPPSNPLPAPSPSPLRSPLSPPGTLPPDLGDSLRALLERIEEAKPPRGTGSITGVVRTGDGKPLAGFEVVCSPVPRVPPGPARARGAPPRETDPVEAAVMAFREARFFARPAWTTATNGVGEFCFDGLADVDHYVSVRRQGWEVVGEGTTNARPGASLKYTAVPVVEVWFEVALAEGKSGEGVQIRYRGTADSGVASLEAENPVLRLHPGAYEFTAECGDVSSATESVEIRSDGEAPLVRLDLRAPR